MDTYHILNFHEIFAENAFCLSQRLGIELVKDFQPEKDHTYIIFGAHNQAATLHSIQVSNPYFKYIVINTEPPQSDVLRNKYYLSLMKSNIVWDYSDLSRKYLESLGIRVYSMYSPEFVYAPVETPRTIDILFVGSRNDRREAIYKRLVERYPNKKILFEMDWKHSNQGEMKKLLQSADTVLNIPYYNSNILETHRINAALACGCNVVSLYSGHEETDKLYEPYVHFCHDLHEYFDSEEMLPVHMTEQKLKYPHLISTLLPLVKHNKWIISQLIKTKN
jgi:hypothetical protein